MLLEPLELRAGSANEALAAESLAALMRDTDTLGIVGVVILRLMPDVALMRLRPEQLPDFHAAVYDLLRRNLREPDRLLRTDRFEWTVLLPALPSPAALTLAMLRLTRAFETLQPELLRFSPKIDARYGGALFPDVSGDAIHLLQSARIACVEGTTTEAPYALYEAHFEDKSTRQQHLSMEVAAALNASSFELHLQPQIHLGTGLCIGAEALLRWRRSVNDWVAPPLVIAMIERAGLRPAFNRWLFNHTMQIAQDLSTAGIDAPISINLSAGDLQDNDLAMLLEQAMQTFNVTPQRVRLEITETALVNQTENAQSLVAQLGAIGVALSIDDFGTGYSGMTHLRLLPVREIKIDQMFVLSIAESEIDRSIVQAILDLGRRLEITVIAEGVETADAARVLHGMGCEAAQGYLYGRPMPVSDFIGWHRARTPAGLD